MIGNMKRILIGLLAVILIDQFLFPSIFNTVVDKIGDIDSFFVLMVAIEFAFLFFATTVGGYIARAKFAVPAMAYAIADFAYGVYRGLRLAGQTADSGELDWSVAPFALLALIAILAIAAAGSVVGMKLFTATNAQRLSTR